MRSPYRYFLAFILPIITLTSIYAAGAWSYGTLIVAFAIIPLMELVIAPDTSGPTSKEEEQFLGSESFYDLLIYSMVPLQYVILGFFLVRISSGELSTYEVVGIALSMGVQCGAVGINVAHELGHRRTYFERTLARSLLLSSLYMHFIVEHNRGHHTYVGTPRDPASARMNEPIYAFWFRTIIGSFRSAWNIERRLRQQQGKPVWRLGNEMIQLVLAEVAFVTLIFFVFGPAAMVGFLASSLVGILLLETVNYIEHYGLRRKEISEGRFEKVQPWHSWNSDYPIGRILLFELTRHSDHHYKASKKYQALRHLDESPQLPTGYPGMMLLTLIPPLWFRVVNPRIAALNRRLQ